MSLISHLLILLSYALIAAAVAFGLPQTVPVIERATAYLIAEKVETERMVAGLLDLNVDFGQGYLSGEPRHAHKIAA